MTYIKIYCKSLIKYYNKTLIYMVMKYIKSFNDSEYKVELLSDSLVMAFESRNLMISDVGISVYPYETLRGRCRDGVSINSKNGYFILYWNKYPTKKTRVR